MSGATGRRAVVAVAVLFGIVLVTLLAGLVPDGPARCEIPGHQRTSVVECEQP
ncbi:hypothetical protein [Amycolatopsis methanolica]|uniref:Uncharacterized protein n=1 Tax=Amycolatopsis methanolica 239 TaxID=1068978 RepID=A0A076N0H5_AMYME|nr:hypothetical protein [Amycolatopsis methanolica]AIJ26338.1 hypothetical protein AMETH_6246 [Amycolatopsis methanolica 239]AIJ26397.1 hypothetical protein AMETH_6305 [Amycolatopsis methanolica 239]